MAIRAVFALLCLAGLSACASPCERISDEMRTLNAATIRDPAMLADGRYLTEFQELAAQSVEHSCLSGGEDAF